jgi:hypothetical protein
MVCDVLRTLGLGDKGGSLLFGFGLSKIWGFSLVFLRKKLFEGHV